MINYHAVCNSVFGNKTFQLQSNLNQQARSNLSKKAASSHSTSFPTLEESSGLQGISRDV